MSGRSLTPPLFSAPRSVETVNDGSFHAVELVASDQTLSLSIDGGTPKSINSISKQSTLNIDSPLYLGGEDPVSVCVCVFHSGLVDFQMDEWKNSLTEDTCPSSCLTSLVWHSYTVLSIQWWKKVFVHLMQL